MGMRVKKVAREVDRPFVLADLYDGHKDNDQWINAKTMRDERIAAVDDLASIYVELGVLTVGEAIAEIRRLKQVYT